MTTATLTAGFYGTQTDTFFVADSGRIYQIQSDERDDLPREISRETFDDFGTEPVDGRLAATLQAAVADLA